MVVVKQVEIVDRLTIHYGTVNSANFKVGFVKITVSFGTTGTYCIAVIPVDIGNV